MTGLDLSAAVLPAVVTVVCLAGLVVLLVWKARLGGPGSDVDRWREASRRWARPKDVAALADDGRPGRLRLGRLGDVPVLAPPNRSVLVQAPSGSGKTPRVVVPNVNAWRGPAVVASVKADVLHLTLAARSRLGPVMLFDPTGATGLESWRWSPLLGVDSYDQALRVAHDLCEAAKANREGAGIEGQSFWDSQGRQMMAPVVFAAAMTGGSMADVDAWMKLPAGEQHVAGLLDRLGDDRAAVQWELFLSTEFKLKSDIKSTASEIFEAWARPELADATDVCRDDGRPVIDLDRLVLPDGGPDGGPATLYLVAPASDQEALTPVFATVVNAILRRVELAAARRGTPLDPSLLLCLDEAANIAPLRKLDRVLSKAAGEGATILTVWQDQGQLEKIYGRAVARTVLSNSYVNLYLPGINDYETLRQLSDAIGDDTYVHRSTTSSMQGGSTTTSPQQMRVAPIEALRAMPVDQAIAITGSWPAMRLRVPAWFEDDRLRAQVDPATAARFDAQFARPPVRAPGRRGRRRSAGAVRGELTP